MHRLEKCKLTLKIKLFYDLLSFGGGDFAEQQNGSQVFEDPDARSTGRWRGETGLLATPPDGRFTKQNVGPVKFEMPKVPVIFVLG